MCAFHVTYEVIELQVIVWAQLCSALGALQCLMIMLSIFSCVCGHEDISWRFVGFGCVSDPTVHLIVTSLGGLQRFLWSSH
ncbi:hypothetical protein Hanom_Chr15g01401371 [Helianthus anomalus]